MAGSRTVPFPTELRGRVALVTGGSRGIGAAAAVRLAEAGAGIVLTYQSHHTAACSIAERIALLERDCLIVKANVASETDVRQAVHTAKEHFGRIDILVNNAGIWQRGPLERITGREWDETMAVNLKSAFLFCREVVGLMKKRGGTIINIASTAGQRGEAFYSHYAASKGGVIAFTKSIAVELAPHNIRVNAIAPGWVDTDMTASVMKKRATRRAIKSTIPRGVVATPEDIADVVLFLASDRSRHIVGATLSVNGGSVLID
jgi:3-oxoacyl-[acyl-carrier protein] reductase